MELSAPAILSLTSALVSNVIEKEAIVMVCHNVIVLLSMLFIKPMSTCI